RRHRRSRQQTWASGPMRLRADVGFGYAIELPVEVHGVGPPHRTHRRDVLLEPCAASPHRDASRLKLLRHPALAQADDQPTLAELVERGQPARQDDRTMEEGVEDAGSD